MYGNNCPECGHLLSNCGTECPFCTWRSEDDPANARLKRHEPEPDFYSDEIRPDQLSGY